MKKVTRAKPSLVPMEKIERSILLLRGQKVMLDSDLAELYGVKTRRLNEQVRRNRERFPKDFMFSLSDAEFANLKSHFATSSWGGRRKNPLCFTEHGALMAASVLNTPRAVEMSVFVVRAFVRLRALLASHAGLARKLNSLEIKYDSQFKVVFDAIRSLMAPSPKKRRGIGFRVKGKRERYAVKKAPRAKGKKPKGKKLGE